jgi:hypothetical protein
MIIREIKSDPAKVLRSFDWFNDYLDTRSWAERNCPEVVPALKAGHDADLARRSFEFLVAQIERRGQQ